MLSMNRRIWRRPSNLPSGTGCLVLGAISKRQINEEIIDMMNENRTRQLLYRSNVGGARKENRVLRLHAVG